MAARKLVFISVFLFSAASATAGGALSGEEIKALFSDKTFEGQFLKNGDRSRIFAGADGEWKRVYPNGNFGSFTWSVKGNRHCMHKGKKDICGTIEAGDDGAYYKVKDGGKRFKFWDFVDGDQL